MMRRRRKANWLPISTDRPGSVCTATIRGRALPTLVVSRYVDTLTTPVSSIACPRRVTVRSGVSRQRAIARHEARPLT